MKTLIKYLFLSIVSTLISHHFLFAGEITYTGKLRGDNINLGSQIQVKDREFEFMSANSSWSNDFSVCSVNAYAHFKFTGGQLDLFNNSNPWTTSTVVEVSGYDLQNNLVSRFEKELSLDAFGNHSDGLYIGPFLKVVLKVINPPILPVGGNHNDFELIVNINVDRKYDLNIVTPPVIQSNSTQPYLSNNEVELNWTGVEGAEKYELEWVYVDFEALNNSTPDFKNATRIETDKKSYRLNKTFTQGKLFYRVRAVGGKDCEVNIKGPWSSSSNFISISNDFNGTSPYVSNFNRLWKYSSNYIEHGKKKEDLSIYDASGRIRQEVSLLDADNTAVVTEHFYDFEGRKAVSTLPVPNTVSSSQGDLLFHSDYNKQNASTEFDKLSFDAATNFQQPEPIEYGAGSDYYSTNNPKKEVGYNSNIPDANNYSYNRQIWGIDGRLKTASLFGEAHRIGSGHDEAYFYGTPMQEKLNILYGSESGLSKYYVIEAKKDNNGQFTMQYKDDKDRVIASCAVGPPPKEGPTDLLKPINLDKTITSDLIPKNEYSSSDQAWVTKTDLFVSFPGIYDFNYILTSEAFYTCAGGPYECSYDLIISVFDASNKNIPVAELKIDGVYQGNPLFGTFTKSWQNDIRFLGATASKNYEFKVLFPDIGSYRIEKRLVLNEYRLKTVKNNIRSDIETDINSSSSACGWENIEVQLTTIDCDDPTCAEYCFDYCVHELGMDPDASFPDNIESQQVYNDCVEDCGTHINDEPEKIPPCDVYLAIMEHDMSPGGQYFDNLSLNKTTVDNFWLDTYVGSPPSGFPPGLDWDDIRSSWDPSWIDFLVTFHPEYCHYTWCTQYNNEDEYINELVTSSCNDALSKGYFTGSPNYNFVSSTFINDDPYFQLCPSTYLNTMNNYLSGTYKLDSYGNPLTMFEYAESLHSGTWDGDCSEDYNKQIWRLFISEYLLARREIMKTHKRDDGCEYMYDEDQPNDGYADCPTGITLNSSQLAACGFKYIFSSSESTSGGNDDASNNQDASWIDFNEYNPCEQIAWSSLEITSTSLTATSVSIEIDPSGTSVFATSPGLTVTCTSAVDLATQLAKDINNHPSSPVDYHASNKGGTSSTLWIFADPGTGTSENGKSVSISGFAANPISVPNWEMSGGEDDDCDPLKNCFCEQLEIMTNDGFTDAQIAAKLDDVYQNNCTAPCSPTNITSGMVGMWKTNCDETDDGIQSPEDGGGAPVPSIFRCWEIPDNCIQDAETIHNHHQSRLRNELIDKLTDQFVADYKAHCLGDINTTNAQREYFTVSYEDQEFNHTIYYYDLAGNVTRTIAPKGVRDKTNVPEPDHTFQTTYRYDHLNRLISQVTPDTYYASDEIAGYSWPFIMCTWAPGKFYSRHGKTEYFYNKKDQLRFSRNMKQRMDLDSENTLPYSYTKYDDVGRIVETGESRQRMFGHNTGLYYDIIYAAHSDYGPYSNCPANLDPPSAGIFAMEILEDDQFPVSDIVERVITKYDEPHDNGTAQYDDLFPNGQNNLRGRVSCVIVQKKYNASDLVYDFAVHYSYDEHGNVARIVQEDYYGPNQALRQQLLKPRIHTLDYTYDLLSGNITRVIFDIGQPHMLQHRYEYDANNRISSAFTSRDGVNWENDAEYFYYTHGQLARTELGQNKVQAMDYAYTINGWLKGVNADIVGEGKMAHDIGKDGLSETGIGSYIPSIPGIHENITVDAFGYSLGYFNSGLYQDFDQISSSALAFAPSAVSSPTAGYFGSTPNQYNGNISRMSTNLPISISPSGSSAPEIRGSSFYYDQLNRIVFMQSHININSSSFVWPNTTVSTYNDYQMEIDSSGFSGYDKNGNIIELSRTAYSNSPNSEEMDHFEYSYISGTNKLYYLEETTSGSNTSDGIMNDFSGNSVYSYDGIGNLTKEIHGSTGIDNIEWYPSGKIERIDFTGGRKMKFEYDANENRVLKIDDFDQDALSRSYTHYTNDAQGNQISMTEETYSEHVYKGNVQANQYVLSSELIESPIYGSSRLGTVRRNIIEKSYFCGELNATSGEIDIATPGNCVPMNIEIDQDLCYIVSSSNQMKLKVTDEAYAVLNSGEEITFIPMAGTYQIISGSYSVNTGIVTINPNIPCKIALNNTTVDYTLSGASDIVILLDQQDKTGSAPTFEATITGEELINVAETYEGWFSPAIPVRYKNYELTNHLGNVLATISDKKIGVNDGSGNIKLFIADVQSYSDYYPFGMVMPGRNYTSASGYRYGFNGMEKDDEVKGSNNSLDFGARIYDPRVGRWLSTDPLQQKYPFVSPYNFTLNNPILFYDPDGRIVKYANEQTAKAVQSAMAADPKFAKTMMTLQNSDVVYNYTLNGTSDYNEASKHGNVNPGGVTSDGEQINVGFDIIENSVSSGENTALYHETEHAMQFEHGEMGFKMNENGEWVADEAYDINDEVKAFEAGMEAPGSDELARKKFKNKSDQQKINKIGGKSESYSKLKTRAAQDQANGNSVDRNHGSSPDGKQKTVRTEKRFFKTYKNRE